MNNKPKLIILDLDGTVYEDIHHFDYYVDSIKSLLPETTQDNFLKDYQSVLNNEHPLKFGRIYDTHNDLVIVQFNNSIEDVYTWSGSQLEQGKIQDLYPQPVNIDMQRYLSIGDLWWVPNAIAAHYGLNRTQTKQSFFKTREYMMGPDFNMIPVPGFKECLASLQSTIHLVLMTNSPQVDSEVILEKLGLKDLFTEKIFTASKPTKTIEHIKYLSEKYKVSYEEILSIGDNYINEILPASQLSCQTIYIDHHNSGYENLGIVVNSVRGLIPHLNKLID
ncbi:HAD family hydrolase [Serpentinicella alkaliphila]|uniref:FMN phosphatase YigB (HAD superfamily) n=1 Tax=Serpentinicella alkaliphila TaxID=1734049 RepID=A0A4R2T2V7_9FIRM|nr:HAD family hydrolase [Serpentinicella alkaliphila]QUH24985.1 HAD family hydrolase [Serpentinicella alkaliphila]TCP95164.1 FMN phosphatase YigB (HAD superfamily) [Serpentinicella alkaliphila]